MANDDGYYDENDELIGWYNDYKLRKAEKAETKEEMLREGWHPLRWWDWCMPEDDKKGTEKLRKDE